MFRKRVLFSVFFTLLCMLFCLSPISASEPKSSLTNEKAAYQYAELVYSDENTEIFKITIYNEDTRSTYNINVELFGNKNAHTVTAKATNISETGANTIDVTLKLYSVRNFTINRGTAHDSDLNYGESLSFTHANVSETAKYYATLVGTVNGQGIYYSTYQIPFNSKGAKYPTNICSPVTGQSLPYNISVTATAIPSSNWVPWNSRIKGQYAAYLGVNLTGYDVHHILPRKYGGTNDYSNLIPLYHADHSVVTGWWNSY